MERRPTIFALSSARGRAGVCVFRISGPQSKAAIEELTASPAPQPRHAVLKGVRLADGSLIDRGLLLWFPAPHSFTGEDVAEFHLHGGPAVIAAMTRRLGERRIRKMVLVADAGSLVLGLDLPIEIDGHALEIADHRFEISDFLALLFRLESHQLYHRVT